MTKVKVLQAQFVSSIDATVSEFAKNYAFYTLEDSLEVGDLVLANTVNGTKLVIVSALEDSMTEQEKSYATNYVVSKAIDTSSYRDERQKKVDKAKLEKQINARVKQVKAMQQVEELAAKDATLKELLEAYKLVSE